MFSSMKKIIAISLCVAMTLTNAGVSTFATSIERVATMAKQVDSNRRTIDYRFYEAFKYEKRTSYLMKDDESDSLKESMQQSEPSSCVEENTKTGDDVSPSFDVKNDDTRATSSDADDDSENDDENTTGNNIEEPEDDGTIKKVSDDDTDTATISDADDSSGSAATDEPEDDGATNKVSDDDTDTATTSDADTTADNNENDETESDDTTATTSDADATESLNLNDENNEIKNDDTTATTSNADVLNDDNKASDSNAKKLPLNLQPMIASDSESTLFGATAYTLPNTWYNVASAGTAKANVQNITISKYPTPAPTTYTHDYEITGSNGLHVYANVTGLGTSQRSDVTIYAPEDKTIYAAEDSSEMFREFRIITNLDLSNLDTSNVTDMEFMFWNCLALTSLDLSSFNTSNVTNMYDMFGGCVALTSLNVSSFNTSKVTDMSHMFEGCRTLTSLDVSSFNTSKVTDMRYMFYHCEALTSLDVSNFNTASVSNMSRMFINCQALTSLNVSNFDTSNVTDMCMMFWNCQALTSLDLSNFNTSNVTNMQNMFTDCIALTSLDLSSFNTSNVINMSEMFDGCYVLTSLDVSSFNTSKATKMSYMFRDCQALTTIIASTSFVTTAVTAGNDADMFTNCNVLEGGNGTRWSDRYAADPTTAIDKTYAKIDRVGDPGYFTETGSSAYTLPNTWYDETSAGTAKENVQNITISKYPTPAPTTYTHHYTIAGSNGLHVYANVTGSGTSQRSDVTIYAPENKTIYAAEDSSGMFRDFSIVTNLDLSNLNTSKVTNMILMFCCCYALTRLNVSNFDTSNVTDMNEMFYCCQALTSLDLSSFNTASVSNMSGMFSMCQALTSLYVSNFDTSNVTDMNWMFSNCQALTCLDLSSFNTVSVSNMSSMFNMCYALTSLDLSSFNTSNVTYINNMFDGCSALTSLDLSSFNTSNVTYMREMFDGCYALTSLDVNSFNTSKVIDMSYMFRDCHALTTIIASTSFVTTAITAGNDAGMFSGCNVLEGGNGTKYADRNAADPATAVDRTYAKIDRTGDPGYFTFTGPYYTLPNTWYNETSAGTAKQYVQSITTSKYPTPAPTTYTHNYTIPGSDGLRVYSNVTGTGTSQRSDVTIYAPENKTIYAAGDSSRLFYEFRIITSLDLSNLDTSNVTNMVEMFCNCRYLTTIIASTSFVTTAVTAGNDADMFSGCNVLEGGNGTKWSDRNAADPTTANNKTYAWIDGRHAQEGYFRGTGDGSGSGTDGDGTKVYSIRIKASPSKIDYEVSEHFDSAGLVLEVQWTDGYKSEVTYDNTTERDFTFNPATTSELQLTDTNVVITYRGKNIDLPINMSPSRSIDSIIVKKKPKHEYIIGQKFDPSGLEISAKYNDGTIIPNIKYDENKGDFTFDISLENPLDRLGNIVVTVTYKGVHTTFDITVSKNSNAYGPSNGGGGGGRGGRISAGLPVTEMNTVVETMTLSSDYVWMYDEEGQREGVKLKKDSALAKSLMSSNDYKENYKESIEEGYIQIQNGFYNLQYAGASFFFGFSPVGKMLTGFVKTKDDTEHYWVDDTKNTLTNIGKQNSAKYYLYKENGDFKGIIWNLPITIGNTLYTFDVSGRVLTETQIHSNEVVAFSNTGWEYNPTDDSWKYYNTDSMGNRYYIKDEVKEITDNGVSHYYIFGEDEKMKTGLTEYKGKTYYLVENGDYKGAVYTGLLLLDGKTLIFDEQGVLVSDKKEVKALTTTQ